MKKKIFSLALSCMMCLALAAPTYATSDAAPDVTSDTPPITPRAHCPTDIGVTLIPIENETSSPNLRLNISTNLDLGSAAQIAPNTNVNLYSPTGHWSQYWCFTSAGRPDGYFMLRSYYLPTHALNVSFYSSSYLNADLLPWNNNIRDSAVASLGAVGAFPFLLQNYTQYYLAGTGQTSGSNVKWHTNNAPPAGYMFVWSVGEIA